tara:strand:+ start:236 stop:661 length:426 start_codon:yes stop_codon:yes gene_type:complete
MPMTTEERKEYMRLYRIKHKEQRRLYRINHKEKLNEQNRLYRLNHKEERKEYIRLWQQTDQGKKTNTISNWRHRGILCFDFDLLYDIYLSTTHCEFCQVELNTNGSTRKCLDHNHDITDRFNIRGILCNSCNVKDVLCDQP